MVEDGAGPVRAWVVVVILCSFMNVTIGMNGDELYPAASAKRNSVICGRLIVVFCSARPATCLEYEFMNND